MYNPLLSKEILQCAIARQIIQNESCKYNVVNTELARPEFSGHQMHSHRHDALAHVRLFGCDLYTVTVASYVDIASNTI